MSIYMKHSLDEQFFLHADEIFTEMKYFITVKSPGAATGLVVPYLGLGCLHRGAMCPCPLALTVVEDKRQYHVPRQSL